MKGVWLQRFVQKLTLRCALKPEVYAAFLQLDSFARTGDYDESCLRQVQSVATVVENKALSYYLASLYLQLGDESQAYNLLVKFHHASREMKRYFSVLNFSRARQLPLPVMSKEELNCLDYLNRVLNPVDHSVSDLINQHGGFSIVGNAPADRPVRPIDSSCKFYFNDYLKNNRISDAATVHVVTPSWKIGSTDQSAYLCITGNNIFHRRSSVWKKFVNCQHYQAIYTAPRKLWAGLSSEVSSSPSAGLLLLSFVASLIEGEDLASVSGYVAGFSKDQSAENHDYDSVPMSERHNWPAEFVASKSRIDILALKCTSFTQEP